jgi:outer membrane protein assembly factor BamB
MKSKLLIVTLIAVLLAGCSPVATPEPTATPAPTATPMPALPSSSVYWTFQTEGAIWGTPAVSDGVVYVGSDDTNLYALGAGTGKLIWKFPTGGIVRATPALLDGVVYFTSDDGWLYAANATTGEQVWKVDIHSVAEREVFDNNARVFDYLQSSPTIAAGAIYIGSADKNVYALDAKTGTVLWTFATEDLVRATATVDNGTVYIGSWDGLLYALDAATGEMRWKYFTGFTTLPHYLYRPVQSKALVLDGIVYDAGRKASVVAVDAATGKRVWEYNYGAGLWVESSPNIVDGTLYIGSSGSQALFEINPQTGKRIGGLATGTFNWGTPLVVNGVLYTGGTVYQEPREKGGLLAFDIQPGSKLAPKWTVPVATTLDPGKVWSGVASTPVLANGVIYFAGLDGAVYAVAP